jgi:hypothetical protein
MVDFNKLLTPEERSQMERQHAEVQQLAECDALALVAEAIHTYHNSGPPRFSDGRRIRPGENVYDAALHFTIVPELLRRLALGALPQQCPMCGHHVDWQRVEIVEPLSDEEVLLLCDCPSDTWAEIKLLSQWTAARRLVGRGYLCRAPGNVSSVQRTPLGDRYVESLGQTK